MKKIGIGTEFYKKMIDNQCYYVDKSSLIKDLVEKGGDVTLFTRPRRFGKTLAMTMLKTFFECEYDREGNVLDNARYFEGKQIMNCGDEILSMMGEYPVIFLSLKSAKQTDFESAFFAIKNAIDFELIRHNYILQSEKVDVKTKEKFRQLLEASSEPYYHNRKDERLERDVNAFS